MVKIRRGDVFWIDDRSGKRPAVVLTRDSAIPLLTHVIVVPTTRTIRHVPTEVLLTPADGMPTECVMTVDNLRAVRKTALKRRITSLSSARLDEACEAISYAVGC